LARVLPSSIIKKGSDDALLFPGVREGQDRQMSGSGRFLVGFVVLVAAVAVSEPLAAQEQCSSRACQCSMRCCGQRNCDGQVCKDCVVECFNGTSTSDARYSLLLSRCKTLSMQKLERLRSK